MSYTLESGAHTTANETPKEETPINQIKSFLTNLKEKRSQFCPGCRSLIAEALNTAPLNLRKQNEAGPGWQSQRPAADGASFNPAKVDLHGKEEEHTEQ